MSATDPADNTAMEPVGGRSRRRSVALVAAVALLLGACAASGTDVASLAGERNGTEQEDGTTGSSDPTTDAETPRDDDPDDERDDEVAADTSTTTTTTTSVAPTTTAAPTTTTTTTAPPPPPTTAPPPPPPTTAPPPPSGPVHGTRNTGCERFMFDQINAARANAGRAALAFDTGIQYIAVDWSDEMAGSQTLRHNPDYSNQILRHRDYRTAGENVGRGYEQSSLFQAFMNSPSHRANIESAAYTHGTVGCLTDGNGQLWVTQNFWGS